MGEALKFQSHVPFPVPSMFLAWDLRCECVVYYSSHRILPLPHLFAWMDHYPFFCMLSRSWSFITEIEKTLVMSSVRTVCRH